VSGVQSDVVALWPTGLLAPCSAVRTDHALWNDTPALLVELLHPSLERTWSACLDEYERVSGRAGWPILLERTSSWAAFSLGAGVSLDRVLERAGERALPAPVADAAIHHGRRALVELRRRACRRLALAEVYFLTTGEVVALPRLAALEEDGVFFALGASRVAPPPLPSVVGSDERRRSLGALAAAVGREEERAPAPDQAAVAGLLWGLFDDELGDLEDLFEEAAAGGARPDRDLKVSEAEHAMRALRQRRSPVEIEVVVRAGDDEVERASLGNLGRLELGSDPSAVGLRFEDLAARHALLSVGWTGEVVVRALEGEVRVAGEAIGTEIVPRGEDIELGRYRLSVLERPAYRGAVEFPEVVVEENGVEVRAIQLENAVFIGSALGSDWGDDDERLRPVHLTLRRVGAVPYLEPHPHTEVTFVDGDGDIQLFAGGAMTRGTRYVFAPDLYVMWPVGYWI
jgi:hypothetical protein